MASPKPFETKTVEAKKSVVDDKLKPAGEMHILVGGPYTAPDGEEHRYGHTALRLKSATLDLTYDFGRYGKTKGIFGESGDGILRVWNIFAPYMKGEVALKRKTTGFVFAIFDHQVFATRAYFDQLIKGGIELPGKKTAVTSVYKLATDYHALGPNCTTLSMDGAKVAIPNIDAGSEKFIRPGDVLNMKERIALSASSGGDKLFLPANLLNFLNTGCLVKSIRIDVYGASK